MNSIHWPESDPHEDVRTLSLSDGAYAIVAIHARRSARTAGSCHVQIGFHDAAVAAALRFARRASHRHALVELQFGGAHAIVMLSPESKRQVALMEFGNAIAARPGEFILIPDQISDPQDLALLSTVWQPGGLNYWCRWHRKTQANWVASGALACIRAVSQWWIGREMQNVTVAIEGAGMTGAELCRQLVAAGARVIVADEDPDLAQILAYTTGARVAHIDDIHRLEADVFSPSISGRRFDSKKAAECNAAIICGSAEDPLEMGAGDILHKRGILYCPDLITAAGGVVGLAERNAARRQMKLDAIAGCLLRVLEQAATKCIAPERMAELLAELDNRNVKGQPTIGRRPAHMLG